MFNVPLNRKLFPRVTVNWLYHLSLYSSGVILVALNRDNFKIINMKRVLIYLQKSTFVLLILVSVSVYAQNKRNIVILATGGTIAGAAGTGVQSGYTSGQVTIDAMVNAVPDITKLANIKGEQISNVGSQDMSFEILFKLAKRIDELAKRNDVDGIVITHGTDTMEETAYFLNLVCKTDKPIILVGSMRPSTAVSADGPLNLYNAVAVAADPNAKGRGVLLVMNDWIHSAQSLTKVSTTAVQTFMSPIRGLIGTTSYGVNEYYRYPNAKFGSKSEFTLDGVTKLPRVDIVYADLDMSADLIDASVEKGAKGIVIAGVGNGNGL